MCADKRIDIADAEKCCGENNQCQDHVADKGQKLTNNEILSVEARIFIIFVFTKHGQNPFQIFFYNYTVFIFKNQLTYYKNIKNKVIFYSQGFFSV